MAAPHTAKALAVALARPWPVTGTPRRQRCVQCRVWLVDLASLLFADDATDKTPLCNRCLQDNGGLPEHSPAMQAAHATYGSQSLQEYLKERTPPPDPIEGE